MRDRCEHLPFGDLYAWEIPLTGGGSGCVSFFTVTSLAVTRFESEDKSIVLMVVSVAAPAILVHPRLALLSSYVRRDRLLIYCYYRRLCCRCQSAQTFHLIFCLTTPVMRALERSPGTGSVVHSYMKPNIKLTRALERSPGTGSVVHSYRKPDIKLTRAMERSRGEVSHETAPPTDDETSRSEIVLLHERVLISSLHIRL
jgi:hypothetical protein